MSFARKWMEMGDPYVSPDSERQILHHSDEESRFFLKHEVEGRLLGRRR